MTSFAAVLLLAAFAPIEGRAALVFSDVFHSATTQARTQLSPPVDDFDSGSIPNQSAGGVEALSRATEHLPPTCPIAWVQHSPPRPNLLWEGLTSQAASASTGAILFPERPVRSNGQLAGSEGSVPEPKYVGIARVGPVSDQRLRAPAPLGDCSHRVWLVTLGAANAANYDADGSFRHL